MSQLEQANALISNLAQRMSGKPVLGTQSCVYLGVDIGTANVISVAVNNDGNPLAGEITAAHVVREGMVVDYFNAVQLVSRQIETLQERLGMDLSVAASAIPPGTENGNGKVTKNILEAVGLEVVTIIDEPTAAALVLGIENGVVVDVGGGTTGISIIKEGRVIYTGDEPTGGFQLDLVIAGGLGISIEEAEAKKREPNLQKSLLPVVRPVFEKVASITRKHLNGYETDALYLVGGTCAFPGFAGLMEKETGIKVYLPEMPLLVTPLGIALACKQIHGKEKQGS
ncbi:Chaperone protein DnaK [Pelotomaculum schinkii]|uniref:Chaperone protein DnaK n=1 Tax=Pelotomaculum schinkii TaxID=78350 RepID=A0A4Y7R9N8_9FIRM|nr:ethanolamine utilization protein EutJ [Pelotomaculum schinkii]TEB05429.1 Chaperone protein DnaK [Pelotomaculum schinkii]